MFGDFLLSTTVNHHCSPPPFFFANIFGTFSKHRSQANPVERIPGIPTTIKTMGVNITTIVYLMVLIIQIGSTIILMVVEA